MRNLFLVFLLTNFISFTHAGKTYDLKIVLQFIETKEKVSGCEVTISDDKGLLKSALSNENGVVIFQGLKEDNFNIAVKSNNPLINDLMTEFYANKEKIQGKLIILFPTPLFEQKLIEMEDSLYGDEKDGIYLSIPNDEKSSLKCDSLNSKEAQFKDTITDLFRYISREIRFPQTSIENGEQGKVYISFIVEKNGAISHVKVFRGVSQAIDYEAKRVIRLMSEWHPATCNGEPVRTLVKLPINFTLH